MFRVRLSSIPILRKTTPTTDLTIFVRYRQKAVDETKDKAEIELLNCCGNDDEH